jgi:SAM-dependent methyltransferase
MSKLGAYGNAMVRVLAELSQFNCRVVKFFNESYKFMNAYYRYYRQNSNGNFRLSFGFLYPCLRDRTSVTPIEPTYFFQDAWAANKIFQIKPAHHYDVGSSVKTMSIIAQFVPATMVDIRPVNLHISNLFFVEGSIVALPFEDGSIECLSSLCVVEHIGLGRYGDPLDPWGSEKAAKELVRVLKKGGNLLVSMPVDVECRIYFNAHRAFTREYILHLFKDLVLIEELYIYGRALFDSYNMSKGFGTGLFHFKRAY